MVVHNDSYAEMVDVAGGCFDHGSIGGWFLDK